MPFPLIRIYDAMPLPVTIRDTTGGFACSILSPSAGASVTAGTPVSVAISTSLSASGVDLYVAGAFVGSATGAGTAWTYAYTPSGTGAVTLTAVAVSSVGAIVVTSPGISVTVAAASTPLGIITSVPFKMWFRGDVVTQSAGLVSQWTDQSTGANHEIQATGANQPGYTAADATLGNRGTLQGGGTKTLNCAGVVCPISYWMLAVVKQKTWTAGRCLTSSPGGSGLVQIMQSGVSPQLTGRGGNSGAVQSVDTGGAALGAWKRISMAESNATTDFLKVGSVVSTGTAFGRTATSNQLTLLSAWGGGNVADVDIAEFIMTTGIPTPTEIANIDSYLSSYYSLPSLLT